MPFLSDPATGAWYPLHWPFLLIGITPRTLVWELALHAFLALAGAYLLARRLFGEPVPAIIGAMLYAWSGFFSAHSSQLGMFEAAALLPWLLWAALAALESGSRRWITLTGLLGGLIVLAGHFNTALYCLLAFASCVAASRTQGKRIAVVAAAAAAIAFLLSAVVILPWLEIFKYATHTSADGAPSIQAALRPSALATVMSADYYGVISGDYKGPEEIRQFYFYGGLLIVPLALAGFVRRVKILLLLALTLPALWYAFGPVAGLARALALLPGFRDARATVDIWFVIALGLAMAAASGTAWIAERTSRHRLPIILMFLCAADLWHWNMYRSPLVFARVSFADLYGRRQEASEKRLQEIKQRPFYRIGSPAPVYSFGPLDGSLASRTEVTYGHNLLQLNRYAEYVRAISENPRLLNGLAVTQVVDLGRGTLVENPEALGRVSAPLHVTFAPNAEAARAMLPSLDPAESAVVEAPARSLAPGRTQITILGYRDDLYRLRYAAPADGLLRIAVPYAPGWTASVDGGSVGIWPADYALLGVIVPAGEHELTLRFRPRSFSLGAGLSLAGIVLVVLGFLIPSRLTQSVR
jgi:hypothetical protein